ncbi:MAG: M55 family metallopeptidase [Acidobacteria bacterium]|nr:M55 family metallopeptidase [Acidobacteriota bacterium]
MAKTALLLLVCLLGALQAQTKKTVFLITDGEGVAGICRQEQVETTNPELRALLTAEINAAVDGLLAGGADEVIVWDGHANSSTLSAQTIHPKAKLVIGGLGRTMLLERGFSAIGFIAQHSKAGVRSGIMAHSYSSLGIQNIRLNGKPVGETETRTMLAGWFNTPVILLTGDVKAAEEMKALVPEAETAAVKEGLARYVCLSMSAAAAQESIREAARRAAAKIGKIQPYKISGPVTIEIEYTTRNSLRIDAAAALGGEVLDDRTIRYAGKDFLDAWTKARMW